MRNRLHPLSGLAPVVLALVLPASVAAGEAPSAESVNARIGRAVNILGYDPIWKSRAEGRFQAEHFRLIREAGFDAVRINLHPFGFMDEGPGHRLADSWVEVLDWAVGHALLNGLAVVLDLHEFGAMAEDPVGRKELYLDFWRQVGERYSAAPDNVVFELLNEPHGRLTPQLWNELLAEGLAVVRATNPVRTVVVGPGQWNGIGSLDELVLPEGDRHVIVTVHYYHPMEFTHQGAPWNEENKDRRDVRWEGTDAQRQRLLDDFTKAERWAEAHARPILLGEFGAYDAAPMESRARYTAAVARAAEKLGWSWAYWQFDSDFVVYDVDRGEWIVPLRDALVPPTAESRCGE
jgi:endoglucanase